MIKVLVTGVFDILHAEHIKFLRKARSLGDWLMVGVESDKRVKQIKGYNRPINPQKKRKSRLEKLGIIDEVFILPEKFSHPSEHLALLEKIKPNILAISSHTAHQKEKQALMEKVGGKLIIVHQHNPNISTTKLINQITNDNHT